MFSTVLELIDKTRFLSIAGAISEVWPTDMIYSCSDDGEHTSACYVSPDRELIISSQTDKEKLKEFAFSDERETLGYLSYDLGLLKYGIAKRSEVSGELGRFKKYMAYLIHSGSSLEVCTDSHEMLERILYIAENTERQMPSYSYENIRANMTEAEYAKGVSKTLEHIRKGDTYQLNLSMKFMADFKGSPLAMWMDMAEKYPAPFYAFYHAESEDILSTSPERFLKVSNGCVLSQPIKGTHRFDEYYEGIESILTDSVKESAELSMIVDLIRNDISGYCEYGSVHVSGHKSVMRVDNLLQMYSNVHGRLRDGADVVDLLWSAFPGGSITGCPKKRSMEIIDALEPHRRGAYCGSIVRIQDTLNMDSNIMIRTACVSRGELTFFAGSGIVADSDPVMEYNETISKAEKFLRAGNGCIL
jgi:para-aminobenzoate synthetase component 1